MKQLKTKPIKGTACYSVQHKRIITKDFRETNQRETLNSEHYFEKAKYVPERRKNPNVHFRLKTLEFLKDVNQIPVKLGCA
ncbi:MAG: hypothetical protein FP816_21865 [Desulfobacteraceae bacterium]|nr:hypothetical protein [Desulfobacteraceae bacterium]MBU4001472.1 hypothetical protein [Pseudomonadota bacterium]